jgi:micrococcal nuclease
MILTSLIGCGAVDGDTIRCGTERIRLLAIDAPEMPGHCRRGRVCALGDPYASKAALEQDLRQGPVTIERTGTDRYGRTVAIVRVNGANLSCRQIIRGYALYWKRYDLGGRIARECGGAGGLHP